MKQKRERLEVIHDILKAVQNREGKIKPTHIMYKANLSHQMLDEYLKYLITEGFLEQKKEKKGKTYFLTKKGISYINEYRTISTFMDSFGLN